MLSICYKDLGMIRNQKVLYVPGKNAECRSLLIEMFLWAYVALRNMF